MWAIFAVRILAGCHDQPAARLAAAIEVFADLESERRPAADALKSWGLAHRFAGSGDRAAIAGLVYDALRRRASSAFIMGADTPRAILLGMLKRERGLDSGAIAKLASGEKYAAGGFERRRAPTSRCRRPCGRAGLCRRRLSRMAGAAFRSRLRRDARGRGRSARLARAPRPAGEHAEGRPRQSGRHAVGPEPGTRRWSPWGLRVRLSADAKSPAIHAEPAFLKGSSNCRTKARNWPRCFPALRPANRWSISAPAPAARHSRSPP